MRLAPVLARVSFGVFLLVEAVVVCGCGGAGSVGPRAYDLAQALNSACNLRNAARLEAIEAMIDDSLQQEEITAHEADCLSNIVDQAQDGEWQSAEQSARGILLEQVSD